MTPNSTDLFTKYGTKTVTHTDVSKGAFVVSSEQKEALSAAGYTPGYGGPNALIFDVQVLSEEHAPLTVSYYDAVREGTGRSPETRMGRDIIRWLTEGDTVGLGAIGRTVFVWKVGDSVELADIVRRVGRAATPQDLLAKARSAGGVPPKQSRTVLDFKRSASVVAGAIARSGERCEMPGCKVELFTREDGSAFLEVHHIVPLAEGGEDSMRNAAALCPMCHRELHFGAVRIAKRGILRDAVVQKEP